MIELSSEARVVAAPDLVWRVVTDFARYETWTKTIRVDGRAEVGLAINYTITGRVRSKGRFDRSASKAGSGWPVRRKSWSGPTVSPA